MEGHKKETTDHKVSWQPAFGTMALKAGHLIFSELVVYQHYCQLMYISNWITSLITIQWFLNDSRQHFLLIIFPTSDWIDWLSCCYGA